MHSLSHPKNNFYIPPSSLHDSVYLQVQSSLASVELFVLAEDGHELLEDKYHDLNVSYPDFFNEKTGPWFTKHLENLMNGTESVMGGFVLQDNWPAVNTTGNTTKENMVYVPEVSYTSATDNKRF